MAPINKARVSPAGQVNGCSPQQIFTTEQSLEQNNNNASIDDLEAMTQTLGQLNLPPINPENQPQEVEDNNTDNIANLVQNESETAPDSVEVKAVPTMTTPVTRE